MRERLPNRRAAETGEIDFAGALFVVTAGRYPDGRIGEVFAHGAKPGSALDFVMSDAAIMASLLLQHGVSAAEIAASMSRHSAGGPASIVGAIVDELARVERAT